MNPAAVERQLTELLESRAERHGIAAAWLFGSVARDTAGPESDVDVAILLSEDPPRTLAGLKLDLESELELALRVSVQLVVLNRVPSELAVTVFREGKLLVERDRARRLEFEVRKRNEFWDIEPILRLYRRQEPVYR